MVDYKYYADIYKGGIGEAIFNSIRPRAEDIVTLYVNELCNSQLNLVDYGTFDKALCYEIDCLNQFELDSVNGALSEVAISQVKTANYTIDYSNISRNFFMFKGLPLSSMTKMYVMNELLKTGHFKLLVNS